MPVENPYELIQQLMNQNAGLVNTVAELNQTISDMSQTIKGTLGDVSTSPICPYVSRN